MRTADEATAQPEQGLRLLLHPQKICVAQSVEDADAQGYPYAALAGCLHVSACMQGKHRGGARTPRQMATTPLRDLVPDPKAGDTTMQGADTSDDEDRQVQRSSGAGDPASKRLQRAIWEAIDHSDRQESEQSSKAPQHTIRSAR